MFWVRSKARVSEFTIGLAEPDEARRIGYQELMALFVSKGGHPGRETND